PYLQSVASTLSIPVIYVSHSLDEILQLADHMLVLDQGKVIAKGALAEVWNSEEMRPWLPPTTLSSLLTATVDHEHPDYPMTCLRLADGSSLWMTGRLSGSDSTTSAKMHQIRIRIRASHVSVSTEKPQLSSIRNVLKGRVVALYTSEDGQQVQLKIALGHEVLWANITPWARDELALEAGTHVYAQVKGVTMTQSDMAESH
ncbi:TOBE domain-containing protein, partial [Veronia pacifica]